MSRAEPKAACVPHKDTRDCVMSVMTVPGANTSCSSQGTASLPTHQSRVSGPLHAQSVHKHVPWRISGTVHDVHVSGHSM